MILAHRFSKYLIPQEANNYKAKLVHSYSIVMLILLFIIFQAVIDIFSIPQLKILGYASNISVEEVIKLTNVKRAEAGLSPLSSNSLLSIAAQAKAKDMIERDYWAHIAPDGTEPWKFFKDVNYKYKYAGENLARDFKDPASAVSAWMASESHKENMLSPKYKEIGVAVIEGDLAGSDTTIIVQLFGTKLADSVPQPVAAANVASPSPSPIALLQVSPSPSITPVLDNSISNVDVSLAGTKSEGPFVSSFDVTRYLSLGLAIVLGFVIMIDALIIVKRNITRVGGRSLAHLSFLFMIAIIVLIIKGGKII